LALLYFLRSILAPFCTALLLVALIEGLVRLLAHRWPAGPRWALILGAGAALAFLLIACGIILAYGAQRIAADMPAILARLDEALAYVFRAAGWGVPHRLEEMLAPERLVSLAAPFATSLGGLVGGVALTILFMGFMLASRAFLDRKLGILAHDEGNARQARRAIDRIAHSAGEYMRVQTLTGVMVGAGCGIAIALVGLHDALFWAVLIFLMAYLPVVGVTIATLGATLFALVQFPTYWPAITIFISTQIIASVVGNLVLPKLQADAQNLDPTVSIFAVALWTLLWGIPGALLAVPLTVMAMIVFNQFEQTRWAAVLISNDGVPEGDAPARKP
jgi:predicted PurR-regulated permease PerM